MIVTIKDVSCTGTDMHALGLASYTQMTLAFCSQLNPRLLWHNHSTTAILIYSTGSDGGFLRNMHELPVQ